MVLQFAQNVFVHQDVVNVLDALGIKPDQDGRLDVGAIIVGLASIIKAQDAESVVNASIASLSGADIKAGAQGGQESTEAAAIVQRQFDYSVKQDGNGTKVTYDLTNFRNSLPSDMRVSDLRVTATSKTGARTQGVGPSGTIKTGVYPFTLRVNATVIAPGGPIDMGQTLYAREDRTAKSTLRVENTNSAGSDLTIAQYLEDNRGGLDNMKQRVDDIETANLIVKQGNTEADVTKLQADFDKYKADADKRILELQDSNQVLSDKLSTVSIT